MKLLNKIFLQRASRVGFSERVNRLSAHLRIAVFSIATVFLLFGGVPTIKINKNLVLQGYGTPAEAVTASTALSYLKYARVGSGVLTAIELAAFIKRQGDSAQLRKWEHDFWIWVDNNKYLLDIGKSECAPLIQKGKVDTYKWCLAKFHSDIVNAFLTKAKGCEWGWFGESRRMQRQYEVNKADPTRWSCYAYAWPHLYGPEGTIYMPGTLCFDGGKFRKRFSTPVSGPR